MLDRGRDDLLNLLVRDGGLGADGVDRAAGLDGLEESSGARHVGAGLDGCGEGSTSAEVCKCGAG